MLWVMSSITETILWHLKICFERENKHLGVLRYKAKTNSLGYSQTLYCFLTGGVVSSCSPKSCLKVQIMFLLFLKTLAILLPRSGYKPPAHKLVSQVWFLDYLDYKDLGCLLKIQILQPHPSPPEKESFGEYGWIIWTYVLQIILR